jgi:hypothetical protein
VVDVGPRGKSAGDMYVFSKPLRSHSGRRAGQVRGVPDPAVGDVEPGDRCERRPAGQDRVE